LKDVPAIQRDADVDMTSHEFERLVEACPRTDPKPGASEKEVRILYFKLGNELKDLARLRLPINLLYTRNIMEFNRFKQPEKEQA
jgi:hypothetical protein